MTIHAHNYDVFSLLYYAIRPVYIHVYMSWLRWQLYTMATSKYSRF